MAKLGQKLLVKTIQSAGTTHIYERQHVDVLDAVFRENFTEYCLLELFPVPINPGIPIVLHSCVYN